MGKVIIDMPNKPKVEMDIKDADKGSIAEAMAGVASQVDVIINADGSVTVEDDGRGIPVEKHEQLSEEMDRDVSTLEGVMTKLKFGGKFKEGAYQAGLASDTRRGSPSTLRRKIHHPLLLLAADDSGTV